MTLIVKGLRERVDYVVWKHGGLRRAARALKIDAAYLKRLRDGAKTNPGPRTLKKLGLVKSVMIEYRIAEEP